MYKSWWGFWLSYFTEAKAEVKYRASARIRGPKHDTRFEWPVSILIMTRYPFLPFKKPHKISAKNSRLLMIAGAIWFCRYRHCTPSQRWMHAPVAKERQLMTSQYHIFDRADNLNPQWMQAVNGYLCELLGGLLCILIDYIMMSNENSTNLSGYFFDYLRHWNWFLLSLLIFNLFLYILLFAGEDATGGEQPQGRIVTLAGPKSDIGRAEKSHKGQNVTLQCFNTSNSIVLYTCSYPSKITMCQQEYDCTRKCVDNVIIWTMLLCRYA